MRPHAAGAAVVPIRREPERRLFGVSDVFQFFEHDDFNRVSVDLRGDSDHGVPPHGL